MAKLKLNNLFKSNPDTGFGTDANMQAGRFLNKDGSFNVRRKGFVLNKVNIYNKLLNIRIVWLLLLILGAFTLMNILFTTLYFIVPEAQITGIHPGNDWIRFKELFFFSAQTLTTVGYGRINPVGDLAGILTFLEALTGFMMFAIMTGILYGRFSKPVAHIKFSENALIAPHKGGMAVMLRLAGTKINHTLTSVHIKLTLGITLNQNNTPVFRFYELELERTNLENLPLSWTVVHSITEKSPLFSLTEDELRNSDAEIYVSFSGFDDIYNTTVLKRTSYTWSEMVYNAKFVPMYYEDAGLQTTIIDMGMLNKYNML